jgi:hypothetical protein
MGRFLLVDTVVKNGNLRQLALDADWKIWQRESS